MKKRIYLNIAVISILVAIFTSVSLVFTFYSVYVEQERESLKENISILSNSFELLADKDYESLINDQDIKSRLTLIDPNGEVILDTSEGPEKMENHINRPEIKDAIKKGSGESKRHSTTLGKDNYYYAKLLSNGSVLRISKETDNVIYIFLKTLPIILSVIIFILIFLLYISSKLTKKILKPVEEVSDNIEKIISGKEANNIEIYNELDPFITTLTKQSEEINSHIKILEEKADTMETITSNMKEGIILLDEKKKIVSLNKSAIDLLDGDNETLYYGESFLQLCRNIEINKSVDEAMKLGINKESIIKFEDKYIATFVNPVISNESIIGTVLFFINSTEKHKLELIRREFSANVSHELKTPLTSINGYAEMIEEGIAKGEDITKFAIIIRKEGQRLLKLIDSIINLSELEGVTHNKEFETFNIYDITKDIVDNFEIIALNKKITLKFFGESFSINANIRMIEELLYNLIDNAIKYSKEGGEVKVELKREFNNAFINVSDDGIGIPKEDHERVFERFYMVDKSRSKKTRSSGLGLSIVKHIVEYHGGDVYLTSEKNHGTSIKITIPTNI